MDEGVAAFASMFSNVRRGRPLKLVDAKRATSKIITRVGQDGLSTSARRGASLSRGHVSALPAGDRCCGRLRPECGSPAGTSAASESAATFHDMGRRASRWRYWTAGHLDPEEEVIIRRHPAIGYDLLKGVPGVDFRKFGHGEASSITNISMAPAIRMGCRAGQFPIWSGC